MALRNAYSLRREENPLVDEIVNQPPIGLSTTQQTHELFWRGCGGNQIRQHTSPLVLHQQWNTSGPADHEATFADPPADPSLESHHHAPIHVEDRGVVDSLRTLRSATPATSPGETLCHATNHDPHLLPAEMIHLICINVS